MMLATELKEQTQINHQILEKQLVRRMRMLQTIPDYINLLKLFYVYFGGLEELILKHLDRAAVPDYDDRRKVEALASDILLLGGDLLRLAGVQDLPVIANHQQAMGALYVIEGSTLGGKIISQMIGKQLNLTRGLSFFNSYGDNTMLMWTRFQAIISQPAYLPGDEMIAAANDTFAKFGEWFESN